MSNEAQHFARHTFAPGLRAATKSKASCVGALEAPPTAGFLSSRFANTCIAFVIAKCTSVSSAQDLQRELASSALPLQKFLRSVKGRTHVGVVAG